MYLFSKIRDIYTDDFHFYYTPIDCRNLKDFCRFLSSTLFLLLMTINNRKIIYYSSEAVTKEKSIYSWFKSLHELILRPQDLILRIPRVYSKDRNKGLIKSLRDGNFIGNKNQLIEYITDKDFREFFIKNVYTHGIVHYDGEYHLSTIFDIEQRFINKEKKELKDEFQRVDQ